MKAEDRVFAFLNKNRLRGYSVAELTEAINIPKRTIEYALSKLKTSGKVCFAFGVYSYEFQIVSIHPISINKGLKRFDAITNSKSMTVKSVLNNIKAEVKHTNTADFYEPNANALADCGKKIYYGDTSSYEFVGEQYE